MTEARRKRLLLALLALLVLVLVWARLPSILPGGGGGLGFLGLGGRGPSRAAAVTGELEPLDLEALEARPRTYTVGRNPFDFGGPSEEELARRRAEAERQRAALEAERRRQAEMARAAQAATPEPEAPSGPQPPPITVTYLGSFGPHERRIAVLVEGDNIYNAFVGDVVDGKFVVTGIGLQSVDLGYVDFPDLPPQRLAVGG